jgi:diguanylate cyclase (GGDEF)-like protein/PAS domain S-box-containing protein
MEMDKHDKFYALRKRAEALLTPSCPLLPPSLAEIHAVFHELDTYRIELELQNDELRATQKHLHDTRQEYINLYNFSPVGYCSIDSEGVIVKANDTLATMLDMSRQHIIHQRFTNFVLNTDQDIFYLYWQASLTNKTARSCELRLRPKNGNPFWVKIDGTQHDTELTMLAITDISRLKAMEADLQLAATIFEEGEEAIMIASADATIIKVNKAFTKMTGYSSAEAVGQKTSLLKSGKQDAFFYRQMWETLNRYHYWQGEIWNKRKDGEIYPEWLSIFERQNAENETENYIAVFSDITEKKSTETRIHFMAYYDALTGLANRVLLHERIDYAIERSLRGNVLFAVMILDLDYFKVINDSLGHAEGDELLKEMAIRLLSCTREEDTVARLGGDEFVILLLDLSKNRDEAVSNAAKVAEKVRQTLARPLTIGGQELQMTVSIGIVIYMNEDTVTNLIKDADNALYRAKDLGRNNYQFYTADMKTTANFRLAVENELRYALEHQQLELYYQAQVNICDNRICGAEVLLRWLHPEKGMIGPTNFIHIAEETGLIILIGTWVLKTACLQIAEWNKTKPAIALDYLAVNVSPRQFMQQDFTALVINTIIETGINANQLELELTESILVHDVEDALEKLQTLKAFGVRIAIDDFGTGYSSLSYLKRFPLDVLKIDQSFISTLTTDTNDAAIVQTIITLAKNLQIRVLAEGVETKEQLEFLRDRDCDAFQGYFCSHALPKADFLTLLSRVYHD